MSFTWDAEKRKYRDADGALVAESQVKQWLADLLDSILLLFIARARELFSQKINFADWFDVTQAEIDSLHRACGAMAFGGFAQMKSDDHTRVELFIAAQLSFFRNFSTLVYQESLSEAQTTARSALYALAGYATYENSRVSREQKAGVLIYKRVTKAGNNCEECVEYAIRGWSLIGSLPGIAQDCSCRSNCRCRFIFSNDITRLGK